jgi:CDP-glucose 4,6-dehydratase
LRNPYAQIPWQHILDTISGIVVLAERLLAPHPGPFCGPWNFGPDSDTEASVKTFVESLIEGWGEGTWEDTSDPSHLYETDSLRLDCERARARLHWAPRWGFEETVEAVAEWYRTFYTTPQPDIPALCLDQIERYHRAPQSRSTVASIAGLGD